MRSLLAHALVTLAACALLVLAACSVVEAAPETDPPAPMDGGARRVRATFVDVGKGDCILLQVGGEAALIDTGFEETAADVVSYLREQGVERLAFVIITHYDKDHVGGMRAVGEAFDVDMVYLPGYEGADRQYRTLMAAVSDLGLSSQRVSSELSLELGEARLCLYPSSVTYVPDANGDEGNDNDLSLVAALSFRSDSYLFAGDLEKEGIEAYLEAGHGSFDVLKVPHHGQKEGNTDDFLDEVRPKVAVVTDAADDPADKKVLKLLAKAGAEVFRTSTDGTVVVESEGTGRYAVTCAGR